MPPHYAGRGQWSQQLNNNNWECMHHWGDWCLWEPDLLWLKSPWGNLVSLLWRHFDGDTGGVSVRRSDLRWQLSAVDTVNCRWFVYPEEAITCQTSLMCYLLLERSTCSPPVISDGRHRQNVTIVQISLCLKCIFFFFLNSHVYIVKKQGCGMKSSIQHKNTHKKDVLFVVILFVYIQFLFFFLCLLVSLQLLICHAWCLHAILAPLYSNCFVLLWSLLQSCLIFVWYQCSFFCCPLHFCVSL